MDKILRLVSLPFVAIIGLIVTLGMLISHLKRGDEGKWYIITLADRYR